MPARARPAHTPVVVQDHHCFPFGANRTPSAGSRCVRGHRTVHASHPSNRAIGLHWRRQTVRRSREPSAPGLDLRSGFELSGGVERLVEARVGDAPNRSCMPGSHVRASQRCRLHESTFGPPTMNVFGHDSEVHDVKICEPQLAHHSHVRPEQAISPGKSNPPDPA